ncbi:MAG: SAM-dependent methyltransferase [Acidimicrobiales bacterium]
MITAYLAAEGFEQQCEDELGHAGIRVGPPHGRLYLSEAAPKAMAWAADVWFNAEEVPISSIAHAARQLRDRGRNWVAYAPEHRGRARLIQERLPRFEPRALDVLDQPPSAPLGSWTLLDPQRMLVTVHSASRFPLGVPALVEHRQGPPSRAYLKLWEATLRLGRRPGPQDWCVDLGASPGGWTWLLRQWATPVVAVDRAPLDERVAADPEVAFVQGSAFSLDLAGTIAMAGERWDRQGPPTWVLGDIACFPARLEPLIEQWQALAPRPTMILTVKLQGTTDHRDVAQLAERSGARLCHLHHNKHELTLMIDPEPAESAQPTRPAP